MRSVLLVLVMALTLGCRTHNTKSVAQQQVIPGELPDPSVIEVDGTYYAAGSSNNWGPVYPIYKSTDLKNWTFVNYVFREKPEWTTDSYWAPELYYHNGTFYCYYTARRTDGTSVIGVATTQNIEEGFEDQGQLLEWGSEAIDAYVYNQDGTLFITWKGYGLNPDKPIQILGSELTADGLSLKGESFEVVTAESDTWEEGGIEGQSIVKRDGYLYMLYSGNACCGSVCSYKVGVARAKTMRGPWQKFEGNPILEGNSTWKCPGHGTALQANARWYYLYHAYPVKGFPYLGRSPLLSEIHWREDTGWPYFTVDSSTVDPTILKQDMVDDFSSGPLGHQWRYDIPSYDFTTSFRDGQLVLSEESRGRGHHTGTALVVNPEYGHFTMSTKITERNKALKGLTLYGTQANSMGVGVAGDTLMAWKVEDNRFTSLNKQSLEDTGELFLKAKVRDAHIATFRYSTDGQQWKTLPNRREQTKTVTGDHLDWWSWGIKAGLFVKTDSLSGDHTAVFDRFLLKYDDQ